MLIRKMAELIEDCLDHIFQYLTPFDWIQVSQVCKLWRAVVANQWKKITEITYEEDNACRYKSRNMTPIVISNDDAKQLVLRFAIHSCSVLRVITWETYTDIIIVYGPFCYKVENVDTDDIMQLWGEKATKLKMLEFRWPPIPRHMQLFVLTNDIKTIRIWNSYDFWQDVVTDGIENVDIHVVYPALNLYSIAGHFPNLKNLVLRMNYSDCNYQEVLSNTLPFFSNLKSFDLYVSASTLPTGDVTVKDIPNFPQLEELMLEINRLNFLYGNDPKFDANLHLVCANLRSLLLKGFDITDDALKSLMSLPNLEKLEVRPVSKFSLGDRPPQHLSKFKIRFNNPSIVEITELCDVVRKMCELRTFEVDGLTESQTMRLTRAAIFAATLQDKEIVVEKGYRRSEIKKLKIERKNLGKISRLYKYEFPILELKIRDFSEERYFDDIMKFVQENFHGHRAYLLQG